MKTRCPAWSKARLIIGSCFLLALTACSGSNSGLRAWMRRVEQAPPTSLPPVPKPEPYRPPAFTVAQFRSPFVPTVRSLPSTVRPSASRPRQYLERFPLDSLKLVGLISVGKRIYALIQDPHGIVHRVTYGNYLGQNDGKIIAIHSNGLVLREILPNGTGGWVVTRVFMPLTRHSGG